MEVTSALWCPVLRSIETTHNKNILTTCSVFDIAYLRQGWFVLRQKRHQADEGPQYMMLETRYMIIQHFVTNKYVTQTKQKQLNATLT